MFSRVSDLVQDSLYRKSAGQAANHSLLWGTVNSVILSLLVFDLRLGGFSEGGFIIWWCVFGLCILCVLNIINHIKLYFTPILLLTPIEINEKQRKLLGISDNDLGFKDPSPRPSVSTPINEKSPKLSELFEATIRTPPNSQVNLCNLSNQNKSGFSWYSRSPQNLQMSFASSNNSYYGNTSLSPDKLNQSLNSSAASLSVSANSWSFHRNHSSFLDTSYNAVFSPKRGPFDSSQLNTSIKDLSSSINASPNLLSTSPFSLTPGNKRSSITTKGELEDYLKDFHEKERKKQILSQNESSNDGSKSLWAYNSSTNSNVDFISSLKQIVYQSATKDSGSVVPLSKNEDSTNKYLTSGSVSKIWLKKNVTPRDLFQFEENLRIWLAMNILQPLVQLIDSCNKTLTAVAPELKIGSVGVDKLKKAAQNISGIKHLNYLLPFLDMTIHQDYLIERLRELSKGGAISAYKWNSGGKFKGNPWREEYPTDTFILLYLFSMYMDNHLPPDPTQPDGRVFSNLHVVKTPEKPSIPTSQPYLYLSQINPPHLKVVLPPDQECEVGSGHKNFLHSLILFCHHLVYEQHSQIAGVNLRLSGINLAWVVNAE